jgi:kinesin family protein 3/17
VNFQEEFQREREDMLDTIRQLTRQLKLKDVIINNFVPPEESKKVRRTCQRLIRLCTETRQDGLGQPVRVLSSQTLPLPCLSSHLSMSHQIERRSKWNEELDSWIIARLEFSGNNIRPRRPVSSAGLRRPETDYAR